MTDWFKVTDSCIRDAKDTVRIHRVSPGWYWVFRARRGEWVRAAEVIRPDDREAAREAKEAVK